MAKVWIVTKARSIDNEDLAVILGVYDSFDNALRRVNEEFDETEDDYINEYGDFGHKIDAENHNNGFAEIHCPDAWDECTIRAEEYELNKPTYESI